jgi:hypothetical protein
VDARVEAPRGPLPEGRRGEAEGRGAERDRQPQKLAYLTRILMIMEYFRMSLCRIY